MADQRGQDGGSSDIQNTFTRVSRMREEGVHPRMRLSQVHVRLGSRFVSVWWLLLGLLLCGVAAVVALKVFSGTGAARSFIASNPCVPTTPAFDPGVPSWVAVTHWMNFFLMITILRSGWQILADHPRLYTKIHCTPDRAWLRFRGPVPTDRVWTAKDDAITLSPLFGLPGGRHTIGVARHWHFLFDILFVLNGLVFLVLTFATDHYLKLVPTQWSVLPDAASCALQYGALELPNEPGGYVRFDALQQLAYFGIVFVAAPLAILTGLAMSPALANRFQWYQRLFVNRQVARSLHFVVMVVFVGFIAVHVLLVASTGFSRNLNAITLNSDDYDLNGVAVALLVIGATCGFGVWATRLSWTHTRVLQRISNVTVGKVMDQLFDRYAPRAEYREEDISPFFWPNGLVPTSDEWTRLKDAGFRDYRLRVRGLVEKPVDLSLDDLRRMSRREQITMHNCIQGWSGIGKWSGLPFSTLIEHVRPSPDAQWVMFYSFGEGGEGGRFYDSHSMKDLRHDQSLLAYEMNGETLPVLHGAPLRLRVENQLGFKQVKWIKEIEFVRHFSERGAGQGGYNEDHEFYGYRDEI